MELFLWYYSGGTVQVAVVPGAAGVTGGTDAQRHRCTLAALARLKIDHYPIQLIEKTSRYTSLVHTTASEAHRVSLTSCAPHAELSSELSAQSCRAPR